MSLYDPDGRQIVGRPSSDNPHVLTDGIPFPQAMVGALVVVQNDGAALVWPLNPLEDFRLMVVDYGDGPEPVVAVQARRRYRHSETNEKHIAAVPHAEVPGWIADLLREGDGIELHEDAPRMEEGSMMLVNANLVGPPGPPPGFGPDAN